MANIIQIQDDLKNVSDQDLVNFVKRPTGQVPSYLALGEIKRRKETREKYQGVKAQQQTTVVDDLVAEQGIGNQMTQNPMSQPTAGVGTPQPQEPINPAMLASKGIGQLNPGAVKEMNDGGIVGYAAGDLVKKAQRNRFLGSELGFENGPVAYPLGTAIGDAASYLNPLSYMDTYNPRVDPITGKVVGGVGDRFADTKEEIARREREKRDILDRITAEETIAQRDKELSDPVIEEAQDKYTVNSMQAVTENVPGMLTTNVFDRETTTDDVATATEDSNVVPTSMDVTETVDTVDTVDTDSKLDIADLELPSLLSPDQEKMFSDRKANRPTVLSSEDALDQVLATNKKAGLFDNPFDQDRKDLEKERDLLDKAKSDAGSMAFIKAGLLWMQKGNLGDAAPAVTEYAQALKGLRGEDRELKKMDLALKGADIAYKQGNVKAASDLTAAAEKKLDAFDRDTFTNFNQALIAGYQGRNDMMKAQISRQTNLDVAGIQTRKLGGKAEMFEKLSTSPAFQKPDGTVDAEKIMKAITPPSSMYAATSKPAQYMQEYREYVKLLSDTPELEASRDAFIEKYPDPKSYADAMGAGSSMGTYSTKGGYKPAGN